MSRSLDRLASVRYCPRAAQGWCCGAAAIAGGPAKLELDRSPRLSPRALGSGGARDGRLELSTGLFYMSAHQALGLLAVAPSPGTINRMVLARGSRDPTGRLQVKAHVALREGMKPIEHLARHRVETWYDECEMERAVEISRHRELPGRERRVERLKGRGRRLAFGGRRSAGALGGARGRGGHGRMPQQKGSSGSSRNLASPVTWAAPVMVGVISPRSRACQR